MSNGLVGAYNAAKSQTTSKVITTFADVGVANAAVMYGTAIAVHRQLEIREGLNRCLQAIIEAGFNKPAVATNYIVATLPIDQGKGQVVISEETTLGTPVEGNISVAYEDTFDNAPASTHNLVVTIKALIDEMLKDVLNVA